MAARNSDGEDAPVFETVSRRPARDRIFETAKEMFYEHGIRAVGVETIAAEADATKMTLYRNFPSKDELVAEVLRDQVRDYAAWWNAALSGCSECPREKLEAVFDAFANKACVSNPFGCPLANAAVEL
ncbi:MAG: transcriptional regulator, TetR family, partial [Caulobacter sp.]|nr:transcriptional regulator, TetR family [Caulobacter sp.]